MTNKPIPKPRIDWDAVERDYRTSQMTMRELGTLHGVSHQAIGKKVDKLGWTKDLTAAIRQATNDGLIADMVAKGVANSCQSVANVVLAVAEVNKQVILSHRTRITDAFDLLETAKAKLQALGDEVADIREAATFVQAAGNVATATKTLVSLEREAYKLDDDESEKKRTFEDMLAEINGSRA